MKALTITILLTITVVSPLFQTSSSFTDVYLHNIEDLSQELVDLHLTLHSNASEDEIQSSLLAARLSLKKADIFLKYYDPLVYKKLNAPLPVEWEVEVFEKWDKQWFMISLQT